MNIFLVPRALTGYSISWMWVGREHPSNVFPNPTMDCRNGRVATATTVWIVLAEEGTSRRSVRTSRRPNDSSEHARPEQRCDRPGLAARTGRFRPDGDEHATTIFRRGILALPRPNLVRDAILFRHPRAHAERLVSTRSGRPSAGSESTSSCDPCEGRRTSKRLDRP